MMEYEYPIITDCNGNSRTLSIENDLHGNKSIQELFMPCNCGRVVLIETMIILNEREYCPGCIK